MDSLQVIH